MKTVYSFTLILFALSLSLSATVQAQDSTSAEAQNEEEGHVFVVVTFETLRPEDGTLAERDSILTLYYDEVISKNELIISEKKLLHLYGSNSGDWVIITEYKNWNDVEASVERNNELFREKWTTPEERRAFNKIMWKYFGEHSDEIYLAAPQFVK